MDDYAKIDRKLDALAEAMKLVLEEFEKTRDAEVAVAGHVLSGLIVRQIEELDKRLDDMCDVDEMQDQALDEEIDKMLDEAGL